MELNPRSSCCEAVVLATALPNSLRELHNLKVVFEVTCLDVYESQLCATIIRPSALSLPTLEVKCHTINLLKGEILF